PIVRITPTMLMFADTSMIPTIYHRRDTKSRFYPDCLVDEPGLVLLRDPQRHSAQRRLLGAPYALSNIQKLEPIMEKHIVKWLDTIKIRYAQQEKPLSLPEWATFLSYDTLTDLTFRNPLGFIDKASDVDGLIKNLRLGGRIISAVCSLYTILEFVAATWARNLLMVRPGMGFGPRRVMKKASEVLKERAEALAESRTIKPVKGDRAYDFLQAAFSVWVKSMMDARTPDGHFMTAERIQTELFVIMSAGTEGFGSTASGLMVEVLSHPTILERVLAEIKGAAEAGKLSYPVPTYAEVAQHLPFYVACVQESLRLHPLTSSLLPREITVSDPELVVNGRVVPIGTEVACNAWICGRDRALYGPDAEEYNPDRWLSDPEQAKTYEKYNFSFGYGSRTCIGKHLAKAMLYKTLVAVRTCPLFPL
ncbi:putative P450 monooxygenase, partial [Aspergillus udagawae]